MTDIDRIFNTVTRRQKAVVINRVRKMVDEKRQEGLMGRQLSKAAFHIKKIGERRMEEGYVKVKGRDKIVLREHAIDTGRLNQFVKTQHRLQLYKLIGTTQKLVDLANRVNMFEIVFENLKCIQENTYFPCQLVQNNFAWISKHEKDVYRYYSKRDGGNTIGLSIFDLIEIIDGVNIGEKAGFRHAQEELARLLDLEGLRDEWKINQWEKYQNNLQALRDNNQKFEREFPSLYKLVQKYLTYLEYFNTHEEEGIFRSFSYREEHVFFTSTNRIKEKLGKSQSTVTRSVNLLTLLGMIEKIPHNQLPSHLLEISNRILERRINKGYKGGKRITFYQVPKYTKQTLDSAEDIATKVHESGMWESQIKREKVEKVFGKEIADRVFLSDYHVPKNKSDTVGVRLNDDDNPYIEKFDDIPF
ncbi:hypothetical protein [Paenibacillus sp. RUD330]|uniref:hypothetical protein n=1 Tax=Paenibacillus sp. RUD330 TaxID=2023772 RepID=UPI000B9273EB|nr:hypothetical protein [Paenibacillus sp. RUD330]ASS66978.1 hypothetical protein CIC07_13175 [Paenibacillus sp. RUD330]